ncbi:MULTISPECIES: PP2C family protein-serine/threonine phosphatase [Streptomyces]|uniref:Phosphoserine phosphatase RsbP n=1 Tax=Streptomyces chartreusis NRRL 3882 TaxID=1079985 RepID=A0A2N9AZZ7_STRCX|nr:MULTISPECIES: SpoIIE family protein phosphatase [Streptomyces]MYS91948.1 SpoIIE family protein phosphatase [Streptomyces sp. SID5464]SOR76655.1 Phosphoserine phosphatase RsbP [Streptomyces chartreusis NRRL 3882]
MAADINFSAFFDATPSPYLVLDTDLVIRYVNRAYLQATRRTGHELIGKYFFDALPENPTTTGDAEQLKASLMRARDTGQPDTLVLQRYDISAPDQPSGFEERWWSDIHTPLPGPDGTVAWIVQRSEDVTAFIHSRRARELTEEFTEREKGMAAELYARARELHRLNQELRQAHARERQVAIALQEAMLQDRDLTQHRDNIAVRYLPATKSLNVCGDWYDVVDLAPDRYSAAVGDVVGHGIEAAAVMGMLRSALSAAIRAVPSPAQALEVLGLYARSVDGATAATAVKVLIDTRSRLIIYSNAGHPPPVLLHPDGTCELLDQATDPPLGARPYHVPRPQAGLPYTPGDTLVLYTDGLIERRDEDIDTSLARLTAALAQDSALAPEQLADALLARLSVASGALDDIALVVMRL